MDKPKCVIMLSGTFNPPHKGHYEIMKAAKSHVEEMGYDLVSCYMVPIPDGWLVQKQAKHKRGKEITSKMISAERRVEMCKLGAQEYGDWMIVPDHSYWSVFKLYTDLYGNIKTEPQLFVLCGSDKYKEWVLKHRDNEFIKVICIDRDDISHRIYRDVLMPVKPHLSSTKVRRKIKYREKLCQTIERLVSKDRISEMVGEYIIKNIKELKMENPRIFKKKRR